MYISELNLSGDEVLVYLRKSRSDDPSLSVEEVLAKHSKMLRDYAESNLLSPVPAANIYREVASSETIDGRPEMLRLLKEIESSDIRAVLVIEPQRLSRGDLEDCGRLIRLLRYTGTLVLTPYKVYDLSDEFDRDIFERELKRGNEYLEYFKRIQSRGRLLSVQEGNYIGSIPPYGYEKCFIQIGKKRCPTLKIKPEEANIVRMVFDMYVNQDMGAANICNYLSSTGATPPRGKYWTPTVIYSMLENVHYIGKIRWNMRKTVKAIENQELVRTRPRAKDGDYLVFPGKHEAIVNENIFNAAAAKRGTKARIKMNTTGGLRNPLAGLLHCGYCGHALSYRTQGKGRPRYLCDAQKHCGCASASVDDVLNSVRDILESTVDDFRILAGKKKQDSSAIQRQHIADLEKRLNKLDEKELVQWDSYSSGEMPKAVFLKLNAALIAEREELRTAIQNAREALPMQINYAEKIVKYSDALRALSDDTISAEQKNFYLKEIIDAIIYSRQPGKFIGHGKWDTSAFELHVKLTL